MIVEVESFTFSGLSKGGKADGHNRYVELTATSSIFFQDYLLLVTRYCTASTYRS